MRRVLLVEWTTPTTIDVAFGVRTDDLQSAIYVQVSVDLGAEVAQLGTPTIWRCAADPAGTSCRVLGGMSTHTEVTGTYLADAFTAFGDPGDQYALYAYLEGIL